MPFLAVAEPESTGVLPVADPPGPGVELVDLTRGLRATLAEQTRGVAAPEDLRLRMAGSPSTATLTELDRAYSGAVAASQSGDYDGSARTLRAVIEDLERLPATPEAFSQWSRAMLRLARTEGSLGHKGESRELLERLVRADPGLKVDPEQYPPSFAKQVEDVRAALKAGPQRKLTVTSSRSARIFVEGREVGATPLSLSLPAGSYRISAVANGARLPPVAIDLSGGDSTLALDFGVADMYRPDAGPGLALVPAQRAHGIITAGASLKLDRVLATSVSSDGDVRYLVGSLYDVRKGSLLREGRLRLAGWRAPEGGFRDMARFLLTGESSGAVITEAVVAEAPKAKPAPDLDVKAASAFKQPPPKVVTPGPKHRPGYGKKWTAVGTGAAALALGGFALYENSAANRNFSKAKAMLDPQTGELRPGEDPDVYDKYRSDGNRQRSMATASGIGAGVALVTSAVFGVWGFVESGQFGRIEF
ncbi:MAG TPA: PEGA domain-containing protein [Anaeromyxobacter sp.]|nr:PEGA domain-containing protein [Anaeromyxobacter sp.]